MKHNHLAQIRNATASLLEQGLVDAVDAYFATDYTVHTTGKVLPGGHPLIRDVVGLYHQAFSGIKADIVILAEQGDRVAWQRTLRALHRGPYKGFPATNRRMVWREMITSRFRDNLIVEEWFLTDLAEQLLLARKSLRK